MIYAEGLDKERFEEVAKLERTFVTVKCDPKRYKVGDLIAYNDTSDFSRSILVEVSEVSTEGCLDGYVIIGVKPCLIHLYNSMFSMVRRDEHIMSLPIYSSETRCNSHGK